MSPARISTRSAPRKPARVWRPAKPVTLPTFGFYGHAPVTFADGVLLIGARSGKARP